MKYFDITFASFRTFCYNRTTFNVLKYRRIPYITSIPIKKMKTDVGLRYQYLAKEIQIPKDCVTGIRQNNSDVEPKPKPIHLRINSYTITTGNLISQFLAHKTKTLKFSKNVFTDIEVKCVLITNIRKRCWFSRPTISFSQNLPDDLKPPIPDFFY